MHGCVKSLKLKLTWSLKDNFVVWKFVCLFTGSKSLIVSDYFSAGMFFVEHTKTNGVINLHCVFCFYLMHIMAKSVVKCSKLHWTYENIILDVKFLSVQPHRKSENIKLFRGFFFIYLGN